MIRGGRPEWEYEVGDVEDEGRLAREADADARDPYGMYGCCAHAAPSGR